MRALWALVLLSCVVLSLDSSCKGTSIPFNLCSSIWLSRFNFLFSTCCCTYIIYQFIMFGPSRNAFGVGHRAISYYQRTKTTANILLSYYTTSWDLAGKCPQKVFECVQRLYSVTSCHELKIILYFLVTHERHGFGTIKLFQVSNFNVKHTATYSIVQRRTAAWFHLSYDTILNSINLVH